MLKTVSKRMWGSIGFANPSVAIPRILALVRQEEELADKIAPCIEVFIDELPEAAKNFTVDDWQNWWESLQRAGQVPDKRKCLIGSIRS